MRTKEEIICKLEYALERLNSFDFTNYPTYKTALIERVETLTDILLDDVPEELMPLIIKYL